jgi:hypothetical protein
VTAGEKAVGFIEYDHFHSTKTSNRVLTGRFDVIRQTTRGRNDNVWPCSELDCLLAHICASGDEDWLHALWGGDGLELLEDLKS